MAENRSLIDNLQEQVDNLIVAQTNCKAQCDDLKIRVETLESMEEELTTANSDVATKLQDLTNQYNELEAAVRAINSCNCSIENISDVINRIGLKKIELVDGVLKITLSPILVENTEE